MFLKISKKLIVNSDHITAINLEAHEVALNLRSEQEHVSVMQVEDEYWPDFIADIRRTNYDI